MIRSRRLSLVATALALGLVAHGAQAAGSMSGQLNAQMVLQSGCIISGAPGAGTSGINMGTLDFGTQPSTFTGVLTATASGGAGGPGATQITCSPDVLAMNITVGAGNNAGQGASVGTGSRAMKFGTSYLPYEVYSDSAMTTAYPTAVTSLGVVLPGTGAPIGLPVFGRVNKTTVNAITPGTYTDLLQVTLSW